MNTTLAALEEYLTAVGLEPKELAFDKEAEKKLPLFLSQIYKPYSVDLLGQRVNLMLAERTDTVTPAEAEAHMRVMLRFLQGDSALVFPRLESYQRNRLVKKRIPFIVPGRQMFLPRTMIDLRETHGSIADGKEATSLSMPAQLALLYHLERRGEAPYALEQWAKALGYSAMSISRARHDLVEAGLAEAGEDGRAVLLRFGPDRRELWEKALPRLRSPVQRKGFFRLQPNMDVILREAGLTALARFTDLSEGRRRTLAGDRRLLRVQGIQQLEFDEPDAVTIEAWLYPPSVLADEVAVDRLSLYLSLKHDPDERVRGALEQLLKGMPW